MDKNKMKTLSIKQPWAYLIATGIKDIENRTWKTNYRGKILIHAPLKDEKLFIVKNILTDKQFDFTKNKKDKFGNFIINQIIMHRYFLSSIIGEVEICDCIKDSSSIWAESKCYHWILKNALLYDKPIENIKGKSSCKILFEAKENDNAENCPDYEEKKQCKPCIKKECDCKILIYKRS